MNDGFFINSDQLSILRNQLTSYSIFINILFNLTSMYLYFIFFYFVNQLSQ